MSSNRSAIATEAAITWQSETNVKIIAASGNLQWLIYKIPAQLIIIFLENGLKAQECARTGNIFELFYLHITNSFVQVKPLIDASLPLPCLVSFW